jgi:nicotinate-nucleotide pyrophosphorylase (carboxylating)
MLDLNMVPLAELYKELSATGLVRRLVELARDEDLGPEGGSAWETGDVTSRSMVGETTRAVGRVVARRGGVVAGVAAAEEVLHAFRADVDVEVKAGDGSKVETGETIAVLTGNLRAMLTAERTLLNLLSRLSGIATRTAGYVELVGGSRARLYDTRKTTPGLRVLEKYAVRCGGGFCHRMGLYDAALFKDNHIAGVPLAELPGVLTRASKRARDNAGRHGLRFVELEVDRLEQLKVVLEARGCGVGVVLLDNMHPAELREAVKMRDASGLGMQLEASGGVTSENLREIAATGIDRISLGTLTHGATWLDIALDVEEGGR